MIDSFRFGDSYRISELCELVESEMETSMMTIVWAERPKAAKDEVTARVQLDENIAFSLVRENGLKTEPLVRKEEHVLCEIVHHHW